MWEPGGAGGVPGVHLTWPVVRSEWAATTLELLRAPVLGTVVLWRFRFLPMPSMRVRVVSLRMRCELIMIGSTAG